MNWWKKKEKDPLNPEVIPGGGGKRMSNAPLIIVVAVILLFASVISYVMVKRAEQSNVQHTEVESPKSDGKGAEQMAREVTEQWRPGKFIPPNVSTPELHEPGEPSTVENKASTPTPPVPPQQAPQRDLYFEDRERIRANKMRDMEMALKSPTRIAADQLQPRTSSIAEVNARLNETRQRLASMSDPTAAYQSRLSQLPGRNAGTETDELYRSTTTGRNDVRQFEQIDSWSLDSQVQAPASPYMIRAGFVIPATMISGINSDLPGQVMAQVSQNVWDTATGRLLLIPQGTRLIGAYSSDVAYGQERVLMAWQRLLFPDGKVLDIRAMPGADSAGYAGFSDQVNNHWFRTISSAILMSGVIAAVDMSQNDRNSNNESDRQRASDALSEALGQTLGQTLGQIISKNLNVAPTLEIRPGYRFNVVVVKDLTLPGVYKAFDY